MKKANYVDGFVFIVPKNKVGQYKKMAEMAKKMFKKFGAIDYKECMGDDLSPNFGGTKALTFTEMTKAKKNETVWFSYVTYASRAQRDLANKRMMSEMEKLPKKMQQVPFDMKRMAIGGFKVIVGF